MAFPGFDRHGGGPAREPRPSGWKLALLLAAPALAALPRQLVWDVSSDSGYQAGNGVWNSDPFWSSDGTDRNAWPDSGSVAVFRASGSNLGVQINGTVQADSLLFQGAGYLVAGGTIRMTGADPVVVADSDASLQSAVAGSWSKTGSGTLTLSGNNTATTVFRHAAGTTLVNSNSAFGSGAVKIDGGGRIVLAPGIEIPNGLVVSSCSPGTGKGALSPAPKASATWAGPLDVNADCSSGGTLAGADTSTHAFILSGPLRMGGTATRVRQQDGVVVYRGGGTASAFELAKGLARLAAKDGLPPTALWSQSDTSTLEMDGFDQTFRALRSPVNAAARIVNSKDWNATLTLDGSVDTSFGGSLSGKIALAKSGTGRQILSGSNTYTGPTSVKAGTLCVTGSIDSASAVHLDSGAILDGTGRVAGPVTTSGGAVLPGLPNGIGTLTLGSADFSSSTPTTLRIRITGTGKPGIEYDRLAVTGNLVLGGGSILVLDLQGLTQTGTATGIATAASLTGTFDTVVVNNAPATFSVKVEYKTGLVNAVVTATTSIPPSFAKGPSQTSLEDAGAKSVTGWATSLSPGAGKTPGFRVSTDRPALFSTGPAIDSIGTLRWTSAPDSNGTAVVRVRMGASGTTDSSAVDSFTIAVTAVNDPPRFTKGPDQVVAFGSGTRSVANWATGISAGPPDEAGQKRGFRVTGANATFYSEPPSLSSDGTLRFVPLPTATGKDTLQVRLGDDGGTANGGQDSSASASFTIVLEKAAVPVDTSGTDTTLPAATDSVRLGPEHGVETIVPPHAGTVHVSVTVVDSPLAGVGIAGADSAILLRTDAKDSLRIEAPFALVPEKVLAAFGTPSVFRRDPDGTIHLVASSRLADSALSFRAADTQAFWLGFDTLAPTVALKTSSDSIATKSVDLDWSLHDNVAETGLWLCLRQAGGRTPACSLLVRSDSARGTTTLAKTSLPLGGMAWTEGRDSRDTTRSAKRDIVVKLDTFAAPWKRTEDRYEMLSLPYVAGKGSAEAVFASLWGPVDDRRWRAFGAQSGGFVEILSGEPMDAQGRGFWVRTRGANLSTWSFGRWTTPTSKPVAIHLEPGWNAVGNPLGFDLPWTEVLSASGLDSSEIVGPYAFDAPAQGWTIPDTSRVWPAWKGVALFLAGAKAADLLVPSLSAEAAGGRTFAKSAARVQADGGFRLSVSAAQPGDTASKVWIGVAATARSYPMPSMPAFGMRSVLLEPGNGSLPFLSVVRGSDEADPSWTWHLSGLAPGVPLVLDLSREDADTARQVWLHDVKSDRWLPAAGRLEIAVGAETERTFAFRAGPSPEGRGIARAFGFENRGPLVAWSLPDEMGRVRVRIDAYDLRGCLLENVVDEELDPGAYARVLPVRSPIHQYLLVLRAGGRKQTLLRCWRR